MAHRIRAVLRRSKVVRTAEGAAINIGTPKARYDRQKWHTPTRVVARLASLAGCRFG